jgi:hypothetical protein
VRSNRLQIWFWPIVLQKSFLDHSTNFPSFLARRSNAVKLLVPARQA